MTDRLPALLQRLSPLLGSPRGAPEALGGGITNHNYRVRLGDGDYVVRVTDPEAVFLGIDRLAEHAASLTAAQLGIGPEVAAFLADVGCLVTRFIPGRPVPSEELRTPACLVLVARSVRAFHDGPAIPSTFNAFRIVEAYARTAREHGAALPAAYAAALGVASAIEPVLRGAEQGPVPCHNDLLNANLIHDGQAVRIVDWEYAGMGNRYFDLGNLSINNGFSAVDDERLVAAYFGAVTPRRHACLALMRIMSDFREAMWGVVQSVVSRIEFDFHDYAARHFTRLQESAADARFSRWLRDARER